MASILRQRRDTAANWSTNNPVIPDGQLVFDETNNTFRIGDGTSTYSNLPVQSGAQGAAGVDGTNGTNGVDGVDGQDGDLLATVENTFTADQTFEAITETVTAKTAAFTPDLTNDGTIFNVTGGVAVTMPTVENGKSFTIVASAPVSSWAGATIKWSGGTVPAGTGIVIYTFVASGGQWYGFEAGNAFA